MNLTNVLLCILIALQFEYGLLFLLWLFVAGCMFIIILAAYVNRQVNMKNRRF